MVTENYIRYRVKPADSVSSLAMRLNITDAELKNFHNVHCGKSPKLWVDNLKDVDFVFIPTHSVSAEEQQKFNGKSLPPTFYDASFHHSSYAVREVIDEAGREPLTLEYDIHIQLKKEEHQWIAEIAFHQFKKNGAEPEDKISMLAQQCMKAISPLEFVISDNGQLQSVYGHQQVMKKFEELKDEILDFNTGDIATRYVDESSHSLRDENLFFGKMANTTLLQILFPDLSWFHRHSESVIPFHIYKNTFPLKFSVVTEKDFEDEVEVKTLLKGILAENCSMRELVLGRKSPDLSAEQNILSEILLKYTTDKETKALMRSELDLEIRDHDGETFVKHQLHLTQKR